MTYEEAKDQVAKKMKFKSWEDVVLHHSVKGMETTMGEVAELYARSKWDEACEEQIENFFRVLDISGPMLKGERFYIPQPEFKP